MYSCIHVRVYIYIHMWIYVYYIYTVYICIICVYIYIWKHISTFLCVKQPSWPKKKPDRPDREPAKVDLMKFHRGKVSCL